MPTARATGITDTVGAGGLADNGTCNGEKLARLGLTPRPLCIRTEGCAICSGLAPRPLCIRTEGCAICSGLAPRPLCIRTEGCARPGLERGASGRGSEQRIGVVDF